MAKHYQYGMMIQTDDGTVVYEAELPDSPTDSTGSLVRINECGADGWRHHGTFPVPGNATLLSHVMEKEFDQDEWDTFQAT